jgi:hypothetical protein
VFENGMLGNIFGPKREGGKRVEKMAVRRTAWFAPLTKYYSGNNSGARYAVCTRKKRIVYINLMEKSERQRQLGRSKGLSLCGRIILNWILNRIGSKEGEIQGCRGHGT